MSAHIRALQAKKAEHLASANTLNAITDRDLTEAEASQLQGHIASIGALNAQIKQAEFLAAEEAGMQAAAPAGRGAGAVAIPAAASIQVTENIDKDDKRGFKSFGEYALAVKGASFAARNGTAMDQRLMPLAAAPSTFAGEGVGADGGLLVPPEFARSIFTLSLGEDALLPMCDDIPVEGNNMTFPKDETTPWGTNGIRAYWQGEALAGTPTKPVLGANTLRLKKLMALVPVTDELADDTTALSAYLPEKVALSMRWKINESILFGMGGGTPLGALNGGAAVTVAKDSGQAANTLSATNVANMMARLPAGSFPRSVWIMNNDVLPAAVTLTLGNYPIYMPAGSPVGGITVSPYGMLLGRPIIISQHAKSFSSQGDITLVDLSYYQAITKAGGMQTATSMHLYFDADALAFRTTFRMDGQPKLTSAITPANGSNTLSPFVQLGAR